MPFITEEIWQSISDRKEGESIVTAESPKAGSIDEKLLQAFENKKEVVTAIRKIKKEKNIPQRESVVLNVKKNNQSYMKELDSVIEKLGGVSQIDFVNDKIEGAINFIVSAVEYFVPLGDLVDKDEEIGKLEKELDYTKGFLNSVMKKLGNERFVSSAPAKVVEMEQTKKAEAETKIAAIEEQLKALK